MPLSLRFLYILGAVLLSAVSEDAELPLAAAAVPRALHSLQNGRVRSQKAIPAVLLCQQSPAEGNPKAAEVSLPAWGGGLGFVLLLLLTTSDGADFPELRMRQTAKEASKSMGVF